ncbi:MAG: hypothetical protein ACQET8_14685 [Bacillota bacterium]|jgi:hypothetical protein
MSRKSLLLVCVLMVLVFSGLWLNKAYKFTRTEVIAKENTKRINQNPEKHSEKFTKKLYYVLKNEGYKVSSVGVQFEPKEISITVEGTKVYLSNVKMDMINLTREVSKSTNYGDYPIKVDVTKDIVVDDNVNIAKINNELNELNMAITMSLSDYKVVDNVSIDYQRLVTIQTSLVGSDAKAEKVVKKIEKVVLETLQKEDAHYNSYQIDVKSQNGAKLNK